MAHFEDPDTEIPPDNDALEVKEEDPVDVAVLGFVQLATAGAFIATLAATYSWLFLWDQPLTKPHTLILGVDFTQVRFAIDVIWGFIFPVVPWFLLRHARSRAVGMPPRLWHFMYALMVVLCLLVLVTPFLPIRSTWIVVKYWVGLPFFVCLLLVLTAAQKSKRSSSKE